MSSNIVDITDYDPINLLTQNEVYLNAVQKASISVYTLGFKPLDPNTIHRRDGLLTAVIPRLDQGTFLDRVDSSVHSYIRQKRKQDQTSRMRFSMDPNSEVMKQLAQFQLNHGVDIPEESEEISSKRNGKKSKAKKTLTINPNDEIRAARPTTRMEKEREQKKKMEEEEKKREIHKEKISKRFVLMEDGVEMVYGDNGNKVPIFVFEKQRLDKENEMKRKEKKEAEEQEKVRKDAITKALSSQKNLWMKSSSHVERVRQQAITTRKEYPYWSPGVLPASTLTTASEKSALPALLVFQKFPRTGEYDAAVHSMVPGDILVTIEHCAHCQHHDGYTHHQADQYVEMSKVVIHSLKETAQRYALRFFSVVRGIDEVDALQVSRAHAQTALQQMEASLESNNMRHSANILSLGMDRSTPLNKAKHGTGVDLKDEVALEEHAIEQILTKLRRSMSFRSFDLATSDFQAVRNEAKVQVLQTHNKHRIGAFEVQVTLCIDASSPSYARSSPYASPHRPSSAPASSSGRPDSTNISANSTSPQLEPPPFRQLVQHVLYSKLYHGAWPSVMKLRERLEILLDTHGVTRIVTGSMVRASASFTPPSSKVAKPALMGPLSQLQHHHEENMRKVAEQQQRMRRHHSSGALPLEMLDPEAEMMRRAQEDSTAASQWQQREMKALAPLESLIPPTFDNRYAAAAVHQPSRRRISNNERKSSPTGRTYPLHPGTNSPHTSPLTRKRSSAATTATNPVDTSTRRSSVNKEPLVVSQQATAPSPSSAASTHHPQPQPQPPTLSLQTDFKNVSLTDDEITMMENEILKSTRAAESKARKDDWAEPSNHNNNNNNNSNNSSSKNNANSLLAGDEPLTLKVAMPTRSSLSATSSSFSSPQPGKLTKAKSVSFLLENGGEEPQQAGIVPEAVSDPSPIAGRSSAPANTSGLPSHQEPSSLVAKNIARPTMIKPMLRSQPSEKDLQIPKEGHNSTEGVHGTNNEHSPHEIEDESGKTLITTLSTLSDHFKSNNTNTLREALQSIQRMLSNDDDSNENSRAHFEDEDYASYHLKRTDTFGNDPFFQQLENSGTASVLRISVNLGSDLGDDFPLHDHHDEHLADGGGVQVAVTKVSLSPHT